MTRVAVLVMLIAACGDDLSLRVKVEHPDDAAIVRTVVSVYESPGDTVRCTDVEFQDISEAELAGLEVARIEQSDDGTNGELAGISRVGLKLVVARGYRENGMYFTAGCSEHGTIDGVETVVVTTTAVATVSLGGVDPGGNDAGSIPITITTPLGAALPSRAIGWRVYGYAGAMPMTSPQQLATGADEWEPLTTTCTGADGGIRLRPVPPAHIGGYAARVRVSWGAEPPRLFTGFTRTELVPRALAPLASIGASGRLCTSRVEQGTARVVCVEDNGNGEPVARDLAVTVANGEATLQVADTQTFGATEEIAAVYTVPTGAVRDAYAITRLGRVIGLFGPSEPPATTQGSFASDGLVAEVMPLPACKSADRARLVVRTVDVTSNLQKLWLMDALGGPHLPFGTIEGQLTDGDLIRLASAGCVTELSTGSTEPISRQVIVVDTLLDMEPRSAAFYDCESASGRCATALPLPFNGVGFKRGNNGGEDRIVASLFDASGTVVSELIFLDGRLVERGRIASAAVPDHIVSGQFDGDAGADLLWDFTALGLQQSNFQIAYAREVEGAPLTALTGPRPVTVSEMFTVDVTGDGFDDIVLVQHARDGSTPNQVSVIAAGAPAAPITIRPDDECR